jgi:hypothetical protein
VAKVPFAKNCGCIAKGFQHFGNGGFIRVYPNGGGMVERTAKAQPVWVAAGKQSQPRGAANGLRRIVMRKQSPIRSQPVNIGRLKTGGSGNAQVAIAHIVHIDEDDIGESAGLVLRIASGTLQKARQQKQKQQHFSDYGGKIKPIHVLIYGAPYDLPVDFWCQSKGWSAE